jgi:flagellar basal-body rod protein FlgG
MQSGFYSATGGMISQFHKLDTTTNNLANLNTSGFKRDEMIFGDYLRLAKETHDELPLENQTVDGAKFFNRATVRVPQIVDRYSDFSVGTMKQTYNPLDLALVDKELFFAVTTPEGNRLTRNGSFTTDRDGFLVTQEGFKVLDKSLKPISIDLTAEIQFDKNGIFLNGGNSRELMIVRPENLRTLTKEGSGLFSIANENEIINYENSLAVEQGYVETSNVNAVREMAGLIEANRMVSMYQKVMDTQMNDLNRDAIEKLASSRG